MKTRGVVAAALGLLCATSTVSASNYVGLSAFGVDTDELRATEEGVGFRLNYGWGSHDHLKWEFQFSQTALETGAGAGTDFYQSIVGIDAAWRFLDASRWQPYLLLGIGAVYDDVSPDTQDDTNAFANAGLGLLTPPLTKNNTRLRFDVRYVHSEFTDGIQDLHYGLGVEIPLWQERVVERVVEKVVYQEVEVPVVQPAPQPTDSDFDGVVDSKDHCPSSLRGARVDANGCVIQQQVIVLNGIQFASDSARLLAGSNQQLAAVAQAMQSQPSMHVEIAGHTDSTGSYAHNQVLSERRANAVRNQLINRGVEARRLTARGYGESNPVTGNNTAEGRAQNRRVEFRVLGQ
ncbi:MAG: OmpA family protein [Gammaproteobacteria bacterium]|nr:OmpA family protein [Gammaproteobacteria bacterium]